MTSGETNPATSATEPRGEDDIARVLAARFAHAGEHSGVRELCRIVIRYRLRQRESENA